MSLGVFNISFLQMRKHRAQKGNLPKLTQFSKIPKQDLNSGSLNPTVYALNHPQCTTDVS